MATADWAGTHNIAPPPPGGVLVEGGQRVVLFHRINGVQQEVVGEGTHFLIPWFQRAIHYDVRMRPRRIETVTGTKGAAPPPPLPRPLAPVRPTRLGRLTEGARGGDKAT